MFSVTTMAAVAIATLLVGFAIGWAVAASRTPRGAAVHDLETQLERANQAHADYESEVREHFARTAELLNRLTEDYRTVYQHVAAGAEQLCDGQVAVPATSIEHEDSNNIPPQLVTPEQPLDYAPRRDPSEHGQLAEDFGLEKNPGVSDIRTGQ